MTSDERSESRKVTSEASQGKWCVNRLEMDVVNCDVQRSAVFGTNRRYFTLALLTSSSFKLSAMYGSSVLSTLSGSSPGVALD